jgi:exodeoxyribonuclease VII large subunit
LDVDAIVVTRGGGSFEDLFAFSDERVVRAIASAKHPVLAAIGHTVDQQLADFAADIHAETPSDAAARMGFETRVLRERLGEGERRARAIVAQRLDRLGAKLEASLTRSKLSDPRQFLVPAQQRLDALAEALESARRRDLEAKRERLAAALRRLSEQDPRVRLERRASRFRELATSLERLSRERFAGWRRDLERSRALEPAARGALESLRRRVELQRAKLDGNDPEAILQKGYAIVTHDGRAVLDPREAPPGSTIRARLARGTLSARVETGEPNGNQRIG